MSARKEGQLTGVAAASANGGTSAADEGLRAGAPAPACSPAASASSYRVHASERRGRVAFVVSAALCLVAALAAVMLGSSETTFYTIAIYYGSAGIVKTRYTIPAALCADLVMFWASAFAVRLLMGT